MVAIAVILCVSIAIFVIFKRKSDYKKFYDEKAKILSIIDSFNSDIDILV